MGSQSADGQPSPSAWLLAMQFLAYYLIWILICGLGLWLIFRIRTVLVEDILFLRLNPWQLRSVDRWIVYGLGAVWIVGIYLIEGYLRRSKEQGRLMVDAGRLLAAELVLIGLSILIQLV